MDLIPHIWYSLTMTAPLLILLVTALAVLVADVMLPRRERWTLAIISMVGVGIAFAALHMVGCPPPEERMPIFFGALGCDMLVFLAHNIILAATLFLILLSPAYLSGRNIPHGEYYALMLFAAIGMLALAASAELLALFLNLELLSITMIVLAGIEHRNLRSSEAAFKYFLLASFAAAFLLFGIALVFGATGGRTRLADISAVISAGQLTDPRFLAAGVAMMLIGLGFKQTLAPFHMYAPDLYEGAPTPVAAAVATGSKVAGFVALFHVIEAIAVPDAVPRGLWAGLWIVAVTSMLVGNIGAVVQPHLKRLLAYSSIAHSGYTVIPMVVVLARPELLDGAREAVAYYLMAYTVMTLLAFGVAASLGPAGETRIAHYAGLGRRAPIPALMMALAMVSLIGIPPTVGFFGKLYLFGMAIDGTHYWLAGIGVPASVASASYYLRVIVTMYMEEPGPALEGVRPAPLDGINYALLWVCAACVVTFAIFPSIFLTA